MRPDNPPDDPRTLRAYLIDQYSDSAASYLRAAAAARYPDYADDQQALSRYWQRKADELQSGEPVALTAGDVPQRFWPDGASRLSAYVLEPDDRLRVAVADDPEAALDHGGGDGTPAHSQGMTE